MQFLLPHEASTTCPAGTDKIRVNLHHGKIEDAVVGHRRDLFGSRVLTAIPSNYLKGG